MTICKFTLSFVIIQFYLVYFIVGITPVLTSRSSFICLLCHFEKKQKTKNPPSIGGLFIFDHFLYGTAYSPGSSCILSAPVLNQPFLQGVLIPFFRECY